MGTPPHTKFLFLGNYSRGESGLSVETLCLLLAMKKRYPDSIHLLRGNYDCVAMASLYGVYSNCLYLECIEYLTSN